MGLIDEISGRKVYFDTNIFIYLLEGFDAAERQIQQIREVLLTGSCEVHTSELTLCELLVLPYRNGASETIKTYRRFLEESGAVSLIPTVRDTYLRSSYYRGHFGLKMPDAIHVASAEAADCNAFLTNDLRLRLPKSIALVPFMTN